MFRFLLIAAPASPFIGDDYPSAFIPQLWANESIAILEENMVMGNLVHRDFENVIQSYGDTVNTRKPGEFKAIRKASSDPVTVQATTATNIPVKLDQQIHTTFLIRDADQSKAFQDLVMEYLRPAMLSVARQVDLIVTAQMHQFHRNSAGHLMGLNADNSEAYMLETRQKLNTNKAYVDNRYLVLGSVAETALLSNHDFTSANIVGDEGTAMREAALGRKFGFDCFMSQNMPYVGAGQTTVTGAINNAPGYYPGATTITVDGFSAVIQPNSYISISGDDTPLRVVSTTGGATPTAIVLNRGLTHAVADNAAVIVWNNTGTISQAYPNGYVKYLQTAGNAPVQVGQPVTFGNVYGVGAVYCIIDVIPGTSNQPQILLDRPLAEDVASGASLNVGPPGSYNFAFHRNALALVNRPLALPMPGTGARAAQASYNGISMRVTMAYDPYAQGHLVTVDSLLGVAVLDLNLGAVMLG